MIKRFDVHPREKTFGIKLLNATREKRLVVVFYCDHVKSTLEKEIKQQLIPHRDKVCETGFPMGRLSGSGEVSS
jgi:hypothetical protein